MQIHMSSIFIPMLAHLLPCRSHEISLVSAVSDFSSPNVSQNSSKETWPSLEESSAHPSLVHLTLPRSYLNAPLYEQNISSILLRIAYMITTITIKKKNKPQAYIYIYIAYVYVMNTFQPIIQMPRQLLLCIRKRTYKHPK